MLPTDTALPLIATWTVVVGVLVIIALLLWASTPESRPPTDDTDSTLSWLKELRPDDPNGDKL